MAARFGSFGFLADEEPVADTGWSRPKITADVLQPVGGGLEAALTMGVGSKRRVIEIFMTPARFRFLQHYILYQGPLTDWEATPVAEDALLLGVECADAVSGWYGGAAAKVRVRLTFLWRSPP